MYTKTCSYNISSKCCGITEYKSKEEYDHDTLYRGKFKIVCKKCFYQYQTNNKVSTGYYEKFKQMASEYREKHKETIKENRDKYDWYEYNKKYKNKLNELGVTKMSELQK